jgi:hypothetical protein
MPKFQQRHYEAIADIMRGMKVSESDYTDEGIGKHHMWVAIMDDLINMFARDNSKFNREKFEKRANRG